MLPPACACTGATPISAVATSPTAPATSFRIELGLIDSISSGGVGRARGAERGGERAGATPVRPPPRRASGVLEHHLDPREGLPRGQSCGGMLRAGRGAVNQLSTAPWNGRRRGADGPGRGRVGHVLPLASRGGRP